MSGPDSQTVVLGHIASAHGIRGEVLVRTYTAVPGDIAAYGPLTDASGQRQFEIAALRVTGKGVVMRIKGINDRTAAEALRGTTLHAERSALPPTGDGEYYHADLVGLSAVSAEGAAIGTIISVQNFGAGDLLEIKIAGRQDTELVPFTGTFVPAVDLAAGRATVIMPDLVGDPEPASSAEESEDGGPAA